ncbi:MAG: cytochrome c oxidase subunit 4 [Myxococcota bacterium]|jgi:cytochrome c oxidase subunit 4
MMESSESTEGGYIRGKSAPKVSEAQHHVMPVSTYLKVFGALMFLTVVTVLISYMSLGEASLLVALFVAVVKSAFVIGFFMHLKYDTKFHAFIFFSTLFFIGIFFALTFFDLNTRDSVAKDFDQEAEVRDSGVIAQRNIIVRPLSEFTPEQLEDIKHAIHEREAAIGHAKH